MFWRRRTRSVVRMFSCLRPFCAAFFERQRESAWKNDFVRGEAGDFEVGENVVGCLMMVFLKHCKNVNQVMWKSGI